MHIHMHIHTYIHTYTHTYIHIYNENLYIYIYIYIPKLPFSQAETSNQMRMENTAGIFILLLFTSVFSLALAW